MVIFKNQNFIMDTLRNLQALVKSTIQITTSDGDYEGVLRLVCPVTRKVILEKLIFLPKRLLMGVLQFHISQILSYKLISKTESNPSVKFQDKQTPLNTTLGDNGMDCSNVTPKDTYTFNLPQYPNLKLSTESVILDNLGEEFHQAVTHIQQQDSIGVSLEGPSIGRDGILSWICIATPICTFLFDVQNLKEKAFTTKHLLKNVFESPKIEKILHDCRKVSDCLYHQFDTKLVNVFDTQVADLVIALQVNQKGTIPQKVNSLNFCIDKYLNVSDSLAKPKQRSYIDEVIYYRTRPLQNETKNLLIRNVIYLRALKQRLHNLLLNPFHRAVGVYLQVLQNATDRELLLQPPSEDEVPLQLIMEGLQTVRFRDPVQVSSFVSPDFRVGNSVESYANLCKSNKYNSVKNPYKTDYGTPSVNKLHINIFDPGATVKSDGYTRNVESLHQTVTTIQSEGKNEVRKKEKLNCYSFMEDKNTKSQSMNCKQVINNSELNGKSLEIINKEKFRLSRQKFHNLNSHNIEGAKYHTDNSQAITASSIESNLKNEEILTEDPYAKLREAFKNTSDTDTQETVKLKFIPAGMS